MRWLFKKIPVVLSLCLALTLCACSGPWIKSPPESVTASAATHPTRQAPLARPRVAPTTTTVRKEKAPRPITNSWQQLAADFSWPSEINPTIQREIKRLTRRPQGFQRYSKNAAPYLGYIVEVLRSRNLPAELALIPLIESGYRAKASSPYGASGLWQFMPATASRFGLQRSSWYDARKDVVASTRAALEYLENLYRDFNNDWLLAIAAYNCGPATVRRALRESPGADYWALLPQLPPETQTHIPRLLAAVAIVAAPARYGIELYPIATTPRFATIKLQRPLQLSRLNEIERWPQAEFARLNAAYKRAYTGPTGPFQLHVPIPFKAQAVDFIAALPERDRNLKSNYTVRKGDTLSAIAQRYDTTVKTLRRDNNLSSNFLKVGRDLVVGGGELSALESSASDESATFSEHVVKRGDSLWTIARRYRTSTRTLAHLNNIPVSTTLQPGQRLRVTGRQLSSGYAVKHGDSLWTIARKFKVTVQQLRSWNSLPRRRALQPGQRLIVAHPSSV